MKITISVNRNKKQHAKKNLGSRSICHYVKAFIWN